MTEADILQYRLEAQHLSTANFTTPQEAVAWLGGVQSQDFAGAKWALAQRGMTLSNQLIDQAYDEGHILRTHVFRPTWHFVMPADIKWMLELTAPRIIAASVPYYRQFGLDDTFFAKSNALITEALKGGQYKTRKELGEILEAQHMGGSSQRLSFIVMRAELDALICSGPMRGKQYTYGLLAERAPQADSLPKIDACAQLAARYFRSHGPATLKDFAWWSGLTNKDAQAGLEVVKVQLSSQEVAGKTYWFDGSVASKKVSHSGEPMAFLLQNYDEYVVAYADRSFLFNAKHVPLLGARTNPLFYNCIIYNGQIAGIWKRTIRPRDVLVSWKLFEPTTEKTTAVQAAFKRYSEFLKLPITLDKIQL